jgi:hypothetical protein
LGAYYRKVRIYLFFIYYYYYFFPTDPVSVTVAGLQGTASHESGMFVWGLALEVEAPG